MTALFLFVGAMVAIFGFVVWASRLATKAQTAKSIGDLLNDEKKANDDLQIRNEVLSSDPATANRRLQDKWTRPE